LLLQVASLDEKLKEKISTLEDIQKDYQKQQQQHDKKVFISLAHFAFRLPEFDIRYLGYIIIHYIIANGQLAQSVEHSRCNQRF